MYYILCYKDKVLGKPMSEEEAMEKYEELRHCLKCISLKKLSEWETEQMDLNVDEKGDKPILPRYING